MESLIIRDKNTNASDRKSYIYALVDPISGRARYIGQSVNPKQRFSEHLRKKEHTHKYHWIQSLKTKKLKPFIFILEKCDCKNIDERETFWIQYLRTAGVDLVNATDGGEGVGRGEHHPMFGKKHSPEYCEKMSKKLSGKNNPMFGKSGINSPNFGKKRSQEFCDKQKGTNNPFFGKHHTEEGKAKLRQAHLGKKLSAEHKLKISLGGKGKKRSKAFGLRVSARLRGIPRTPEVKQKISNTLKERARRVKSEGVNEKI